jgi:hypothetical protein
MRHNKHVLSLRRSGRLIQLDADLMPQLMPKVIAPLISKSDPFDPVRSQSLMGFQNSRAV